MTQQNSTPPKRHAFTWGRIHRDAAALGARLRALAPADGGWRGVIAISVGGLVPAVLVARELDLKVIETVCVSSYRGEVRHDVETRGNLVIHKGVAGSIDDGGHCWLLVDDLVDTGATAEAVRNMLPKAH
ncbi:MAG: xanthine phosphoribosyltransferase, partial [Hyphomicrobiales bacterium]|nr:xanthine phosphoribosyltransferase [Hyphomicrobiales bacterium]